MFLVAFGVSPGTVKDAIPLIGHAKECVHSEDTYSEYRAYLLQGRMAGH